MQVESNLLPALVDELTTLNTQAAVIDARAKEIKQQLIATGLDEVCGSVTRAIVVRIPDSTTTDWEAIAHYLNASAAVIADFQKPKRGSTQVRVLGYNLRKAA